MAKTYVTRREVFCASHLLWNKEFSDEQNFEIYDKCANPNGHGHNYILEVTVAGEIKNDTGYMIDFKKLRQLVRTEIVDKVDHKHLNFDVDFLHDVIPTAENLAVAFWNILEPKIADGELYAVRLRETENNVVEYRGE
ncbi:MAG TPA: 6-carboxytetrahydropterin synthase [Bacteroidota bacterium]|nr:6-carboxytetrahydropterin synthase [Bacteroidota bacterium]